MQISPLRFGTFSESQRLTLKYVKLPPGEFLDTLQKLAMKPDSYSPEQREALRKATVIRLQATTDLAFLRQTEKILEGAGGKNIFENIFDAFAQAYARVLHGKNLT